MKKEMVEGKIHYCSSIPENMTQIVIYCHGLGEDKSGIDDYKSILNKKNIGVLSFDFPCHGEDTSKDIDFTLINCMNYLQEMIQLVREDYHNIPISLVGSSFGGYVILQYINQTKELFHHVFLRYPAINFWECVMRKLKLPENYFDIHSSIPLRSDFQLSKEACMQFQRYDLMKKFHHYDNNICIIHGDEDHTVLLDDVLKFSRENQIPLQIIHGAHHGMKEYQEEANNVLVDFLCQDM